MSHTSHPESRNGLLLIDKQAGITSHDVVHRVRNIAHQRKIGHCGTLDPDATGLMLLTFGRGTRLTRFLIRAPKVYEGIARFGVTTDTYDAAGEIVAEAPTNGLGDDKLQSLMAEFVGEYDQTPPPYCAKKIKGVKYYELARKGEEVPKETKTVTVFEFAPLGLLTDDRLGFRLSCSSGTYARSLVHHMGEKLACGAHLQALRRLQVGPFKLDHALTLPELEKTMNEQTDLGPAWIPFDDIPLPFTQISTDQQQERRIVHGQTVLVPSLEGEEGDWVKLTNRRNEFIAVGTVVELIGHRGVGVIQPRIVFK